jgi:hypothetical protein
MDSLSRVTVVGPMGRSIDSGVFTGGRQVSLQACQSTEASTLIDFRPSKLLGAVMLVVKYTMSSYV